MCYQYTAAPEAEEEGQRYLKEVSTLVGILNRLEVFEFEVHVADTNDTDNLSSPAHKALFDQIKGMVSRWAMNEMNRDPAPVRVTRIFKIGDKIYYVYVNLDVNAASTEEYLSLRDAFISAINSQSSEAVDDMGLLIRELGRF